MRKLAIFLLLAVFGLVQCKKDDPEPVIPPAPKGDLEDIPYNPTPYTIMKPAHFPEVPVPADNPMTLEGVQLGRRLFYDPVLSGDSSMSCSSCHHAELSFSDGRTVAIGIDSINGRRNAMSLLNVAYNQTGLFWDGRSPTLEDQALHPVEDVIELHATWAQVVAKLQAHPVYPEMFRKAFGIKDRIEITKDIVGKALAQFERILISSGKSRYDKFKLGDQDALSDDEKAGFLMFFDQGAQYSLPDAQCFHCHSGDVLINGGGYFNNGLDSVASLNNYLDKGRGEVTGKYSDNGKFRAPSLRNITMTGPYMHDGRFKTLEEVIDHYGDGAGTGVENEDPFISAIGTKVGSKYYLTAEQKANILKFLQALNDPDFIANPDIRNPF